MSGCQLSQEIEVPHLHIVPLDQLVEQEHADAQRTTPLIESLQAEGTLRNPPIVAPLNETQPRFVVLDGANRLAALRSLGYPHVIVQQVLYAAPQVRLTTWRHVVTGIHPEQFIGDLKTATGLDFLPAVPENTQALTDVDAALPHNLLAHVIRADGQVFIAHATGEALNLHSYNQRLNALVESYQTQGRLFRAATDDLDKARRLYPELTALVIFPAFQVAQV